METNDLWVFELMGERGNELTGYPCLSVYHGFRYHPKEVTTGAFDDWVYDHLGIFSFTIELWDLPGRAGIKDRDFIEWFRKHPHEEDVRILNWLEENGDAEPYVAWYPFEHPQLGEVEVGGYDQMYTWRNPPPSLMGEEAEKNTAYALALADMLPRLSLGTLEVQQLSDSGDFRIRLVVENSGFMPTYTSDQGARVRPPRPVRAELVLPETVRILSGQEKTELGHLQGRSSSSPSAPSTRPARPTTGPGRNGSCAAPPGQVVEVHVLSDRAGSLHENGHTPVTTEQFPAIRGHGRSTA